MSADDGDTGGVDFRILGPLEAWRSGARVALGGRQQRAILALLLCEAGQAVSIGRIADMLWGERPPPGYLTSVQTYVFHLRELVEPNRARGAPGQVLVTEPGGRYRLRTQDGAVDAVLFEDLVKQGGVALEAGDAADAVPLFDRALALWRGEVLADLADLDFVAPLASRLQELRVTAVESRMEAALALGQHREVVPELTRLVGDYPLRERLHAQRILALYRSGRQSEALEAYQGLRRMLHEELGIEPSPPLQDLQRAVLAQDPALGWVPEATNPAGTAPRQALRGSGPATAQVKARRVRNDQRPRRLPRRLLAASAVTILLTTGLVTAITRLPGSTGRQALAANTVGAVERDGSVAAAVPVGTDPAGLAYGGGSLWVANRSDRSVWRIDPERRTVVQRVDVGLNPESVAVTADNVWVTNLGDGTISRINMTANRVVETIAVGNQPAAIASGPSGVWVANSADNTIQRIDPVTGRADQAVPVGDGPNGIAVDGDSVWVANGRNGTVSRIDPRTGEEMTSPVHVGSGPKGIAVSGDDVWVADNLSQSVTRVNRSTGRAHTIEVGEGPYGVVVSRGAVWVSEQFDGVLTRIDPKTESLKRFSLGISPRALAAIDGRIWVASGAFAAPSHRGGVLTVASDRFPGFAESIDPAAAYNTYTLAPQRLVYDGLVATRLAGVDSHVLVPDLAVALPEPSNGDRTYTFTLRPGIRYSTGREVHASDFVRGVHRALTVGARPDFFAGILGAQHCIEQPTSCDLSRGVVADDAARRVTFHLGAADPEFLYKLTWFAFPTPQGTSTGNRVTTPLPGTGPYMISTYVRDKEYALTRNPWFHRWSFAAQPDGYPDEIRWLHTRDTRAAAGAVTSGRADLAELTTLNDRRASQALIDELKVRYPAQLHSDLFETTAYEVLNAAVPPFNSLRARQAVNYAVDRRALVELFGGPSVALPTCQMLPRKFSSFSWYCPYTTGPQDGRWHGPDLAKARALVRASGTTGMPVTVHDVKGGLFPPFNAYFARLLRELGYRVTFHQLPDTGPSYDFINNPRNTVQVASMGWVADFPLASNFYDAVVRCGSENNLSRYCNPALDRRAAAATALEGSDPGEALRAWTAIDRAVTDDAVIVPAVNVLDWWVVSHRIGNYQSSPVLGPLLSQLWVQ